MMVVSFKVESSEGNLNKSQRMDFKAGSSRGEGGKLEDGCNGLEFRRKWKEMKWGLVNFKFESLGVRAKKSGGVQWLRREG